MGGDDLQLRPLQPDDAPERLRSGHHRVIIDPAGANHAAIKAYTKVGFRPVGTMREYERDTGGEGWHDGLLMELLASDRRAP